MQKSSFFIMLLCIIIISYNGFSQTIPGPVAGSSSLSINNVQIKLHDNYTHPIAYQDITIGANLSIYPGVFDDLSLVFAYVYKNGHAIPLNSNSITYSFAPVYDSYIKDADDGHYDATAMYLTVVIKCTDPSYGPGDYLVNFQYQYVSTYDYNTYTGSVSTITGTVDPIAAGANVCGTYTSSTGMSANVITNCSSATLQSGIHTTLVASQSITFSPGFTASSGTFLHALITNGCAEATDLAKVLPDSTITVSDYSTPSPTSVRLIRNKKAYPNPTTGILTIPINNSSQSDSYISIYNSLGNAVYNKTILSGDLSVLNVNTDLSEYAAGIYTLKVTSDNNTSVQQIVLEK